MKFPYKTLGLLLVSVALAGCGGAGNGHGAFTPPQRSTITLSATTTTLPVNTQGYVPTQYGNPTQATVTITWRNADGSLVTGRDIAVSISPPNVAALSCLVDGVNCTNGNTLFGSIPIKGINGQATIFVNALNTAGTATLVVSGVDPNTSETVSANLTFTVTSGIGPTPANIALSPNPSGIYLPGSGGTNNSVITATVTDGAGQPVPDPVSGNSGFDNVQFSILTPNTGGAVLSSNSVSGPVTGTTVTTHTVHGQATVSFQSGTLQGPIQIQATADRSDNNVTNGIANPVSSTTTVVVSDGKLYSLAITTPVIAPNLPGITVNAIAPISTGVSTSQQGPIPPNPDATLSLAVSALGTDRQGNPVIPGTAIRFGAVDTPVGAPGSASDNKFLLSGTDGNPQEGGTLFTAPTGQFTTGGGGAGPGDALIVFGKAVQGNADLENALTVQTVNSATSLNVASPFNLNDTTGVSVDSGPVLPYLIGRAQQGNITTQATTNAQGVAHASLTYTVGSVGNAVAIWAQGSGIDRITGGSRQVADAGTLTYPGLAPATMTATPSTIQGDTTQNVTVCVTDALGIKLRGVGIGFSFNITGAGSGSVDGVANTGTLAHLTDTTGCATGSVVTSGLTPGAAGTNDGTLVFTGAGATATVTIQAPPPPVTLTVIVTNASAGPTAGTYTAAITGGSSGFSPPGQAAGCSLTNPPNTTTTNTCTFTFTVGTVVGLTESTTGAAFTGWTGDCNNGTSPTTSVTMTANKTCTATF